MTIDDETNTIIEYYEPKVNFETVDKKIVVNILNEIRRSMLDDK